MNLDCCRGCMKEADAEGSLLLPTHQHLRKWVARNLSIEVTEDDGLPHRMCWNCLELINAWIRFTLTCRAIQRRLFYANAKVNDISNETNDKKAAPVETQKHTVKTEQPKNSEFNESTKESKNSANGSTNDSANGSTNDSKNSESSESTKESKNSESNESIKGSKNSESNESTKDSKNSDSNESSKESKNSKDDNDCKPKAVTMKESSEIHNDDSIDTEEYESESTEQSEKVKSKNVKFTDNESTQPSNSSNRKTLKSKMNSTSFPSKKQSSVPSREYKQMKEVKDKSSYCTRNRKHFISSSKTSCDNKNKQHKVVVSSKIMPTRRYELRRNDNNLNQKHSKKKKDISFTKKNEKSKKATTIAIKEEKIVDTRSSKRKNTEESLHCNVRKQPKRDSKKFSSDINGSFYDVIIDQLLIDDRPQEVVSATEKLPEPREREVMQTRNKDFVCEKFKKMKEDTSDEQQQETVMQIEKKNKKGIATPEVTENKTKRKLLKNKNRNIDLKNDNKNEIKRRGRKFTGKRLMKNKSKSQVEIPSSSNHTEITATSQHESNLPLVEITPESFAQASITSNPVPLSCAKKRGRKPGKKLKIETSTIEQIYSDNMVEVSTKMNLISKCEITSEPSKEINLLSSIHEGETTPQSSKELIPMNFVEPSSISYTTKTQSYPENLTQNTSITSFQSIPQNLSINASSNIFSDPTQRMPALVSIKQCNIITYEQNLTAPIRDRYLPPQQNDYYKKAWTPYEVIKTTNNTREITSSSSSNNYTNYHTNYMPQQQQQPQPQMHPSQYQSYPCRPDVQYQYPNYRYSNYPATISSQTHQSNSLYYPPPPPPPPPSYPHYPQDTYYSQNPNPPIVSDPLDHDPEKLQVANTMINFSNNVRHT